VDEFFDSLQIDAPLRRVGRAHDLDAEAMRQRQILDLIGDVVVPGRDDCVSRLEGDGGEGRHEASRRVLRHRDPVR